MGSIPTGGELSISDYRNLITVENWCVCHAQSVYILSINVNYRQTVNMRCALVGNEIDLWCSWSIANYIFILNLTPALASMDWAKTTARWGEKLLFFWGVQLISEVWWYDAMSFMCDSAKLAG